MKPFISLAIFLSVLAAPGWAADTRKPGKDCQHCGVIQGVIPTGAAHQLVIKMDNGLTRTILTDANTTLDPGDRVEVLGGAARLIVPRDKAEDKKQ